MMTQDMVERERAVRRARAEAWVAAQVVAVPIEDTTSNRLLIAHRALSASVSGVALECARRARL